MDSKWVSRMDLMDSRMDLEMICRILGWIHVDGFACVCFFPKDVKHGSRVAFHSRFVSRDLGMGQNWVLQ